MNDVLSRFRQTFDTHFCFQYRLLFVKYFLGVGYPAVGSICGISNAAVALRLEAPVIIIGKKGVGDAVDSYNLNATFFEARNVHVLGGIFNR